MGGNRLRGWAVFMAGLVTWITGPTVGPAAAQEAGASLERARELREAGRYEPAIEVLERYLEAHPDRAKVRWYLAETLYWSGHPAAARDELRRALGQDPGMDGARELWWELQDLLAPRFTITPVHEDDDQPLTSLGAGLTGTVPVTPAVRVIGDVDYRYLETAPERRGGGSPGVPGAGASADGRALEGRLGVALEPPVFPLRAELRLGRVGGTSGEAGWIGEGILEVELPAGVRVRGTGRRWSDRHTSTSLDTLLLAETLSASLSRSDPTGWSGEIGGSVDRYPGGNAVRAYHAWILAPLISGDGDALRLGYGFSYHDADETTFTPIGPEAPGAGSSGGRYAPYYTPEEVRVHNGLAAARLSLASGITLSADGSVGLHATERAPTAGTGGVAFAEREFRPWRLRGRLSAELSPAVDARATASYREDAFFRIFRISGALTYRFVEAPPGR